MSDVCGEKTSLLPSSSSTSSTNDADIHHAEVNPKYGSQNTCQGDAKYGSRNTCQGDPKSGSEDISENISTQEGVTVEDQQGFQMSRLSSRGKYTLLMLALANLFSEAAFSVIAPFFPNEAEKKGVSTTVTGFIFSIFPLTIFLSSPIFGNYLSRVGAKFMFISGAFIGGSCAILFGTLDKCPPGTPFIVMCFLCRCVEALGCSAYMTASFAIVSNEFPKHVATVFGIIETASGIGLMIGPAIGGVLYEFGGFGPPFFVTGSLILVNGIVLFMFLPTPETIDHKRERSMFHLLRSPMVLVTMVTCMAGAVGISFLDPTLANHVKKFDLSPSLVGLVFIIFPGLYGFTAPLWGYLCDSKNISEFLVVLGNCVCGVGFLVVGPSPFLAFLPHELWTVILGLVIFGSCIGCALIPTMKCMITGAHELGFEDNIDTYGMVAGLLSALFSFGYFLGPTVGAALVENLGFDWGATIVCGMYLFASSLTLVFCLLRRLNSRSSSSLKVDFTSNQNIQCYNDDASNSSPEV